MSTIEIIILALGLSSDAFAVSLAAAAAGYACSARPAFRLAFHFGLFQFLMPVVGWFAGRQIEQYVYAFDHWIAFALLGYVGCRMIISAQDNESEKMSTDPTCGMTLIILSIATSIDALAVGFSLAMLEIDIWQPSVAIGAITAAVCIGGIVLGRKLGTAFGQKVELCGGILLVLIGLKILVEHLSWQAGQFS